MSLNPAVVFGLALVVGALPSLLMSYLFIKLGVGSPAALQSGATSFRGLIGASVLSGVLAMVIGALVQGALTRAVVAANEGQRASFSECLLTGLQVILPLIGLSILFSIGVGLGFILLVVPGVILLLMWTVAVPVLVVERTGVLGAFTRSSELTKGARWKILGLFLVLLVGYWLLSLVLGLVGLSMYNPSTAQAGWTVGNFIGGVVLGTIFNVLWGTIQPSLYVELRQAKEGGSAEHLAEVFA